MPNHPSENAVSNAALASYLIGLREGLEGTLIVSILVAYLVKSNRRGELWQVWTGVGAALALSIGFGAVLVYVNSELLSGERKELFEAVTSVIAVAFVTWMIFWMRRTARRLKGNLTSKLEEALQMGTFAVVLVGFLTVAREGLETAILFFASAKGADTAGPAVGLFLGVLTAVVLGYLLYRAAIRINLARFFTWTGILLILVAAGIFKYGIHDFQESGVLGGLGNHAFDIAGWYDPTAWYAALLTGMFNITPQPSVLETIAWVAYAAVVLTLFLLPGRGPKPVAPAVPPREPATTSA
jgi:high-affinity iron transporter